MTGQITIGGGAADGITKSAISRADRRRDAKYATRKNLQEIRARIARIRADIKQTKIDEREALRGVKARARELRAVVKERIREHEARVRAELKMWRAAQWAELREAKRVELARIRKTFADKVKAKQAEERAEAAWKREYSRVDRAVKDRQRATAKELRQESDEIVESSLDPEHLALWHRVKNRMRGSPKWSRREEFLHYVHENPQDVIDANIRAAERLERSSMAELRKAQKQAQREYAAAQRAYAKAGDVGGVKRKRLSAEERAALARDVPF